MPHLASSSDRMAIDGFTQLFGWRESTWELRVVTGLLFGLASGWLVLPRLDAAFGQQLRSDGHRGLHPALGVAREHLGAARSDRAPLRSGQRVAGPAAAGCRIWPAAQIGWPSRASPSSWGGARAPGSCA